MRKNIVYFDHPSIQNSYVFQPIWDIDKWIILGYQAIKTDSISIKDKNESEMEGEMLFIQDIQSINNIIERFPLQQAKPFLLFIHISPTTLQHHQFRSFINQFRKRYSQCKGKLVFELYESELEGMEWKKSDFKKNICFLKENEFRIAINGIGKSETTFLIKQIGPDYIKIDRYYSSELYTSKEKQHYISNLMKYSKGNTVLILEGVEKETDLAQAKLLNVSYVHGSVFGMPLKEKSTNQTREATSNDLKKNFTFYVL